MRLQVAHPRHNDIPHSSPVPAAFESRAGGVRLGRELPRPRADTPRSPAAAARPLAVYGRSGAVKRVSRPVPPRPPQRSPPQRTSALPPLPPHAQIRPNAPPPPFPTTSHAAPAPHPLPTKSHPFRRPIKRPLAHAAQTPGTRRRCPSRPQVVSQGP
ncbi:hypothetical protein B0H15DRAFT_852571, partial [Mycena belliarum]